MSKGSIRRTFKKARRILLSSLLCGIIIAIIALPIAFLCVFTDSKDIEPPHFVGMSYSRIVGDGWNIGYGEANIPHTELVSTNAKGDSSTSAAPKVLAIAIDDNSPRVDMGGVILVSINVSSVHYNFTKAVRYALTEIMSLQDYSAINIVPTDISTSYLTDDLEQNNPFWHILLETTISAVTTAINSRQDGTLSYAQITYSKNKLEMLKFVSVEDISTMISFSPKLKTNDANDNSIGYLEKLKLLLDVNNFINFKTGEAIYPIASNDESIANDISQKVESVTFLDLPPKINYCASTLFLPITNYRYLNARYILARKDFLPYLASEISFFEFGSFENHLKIIFNPSIVDRSLEYGDAAIGYHSNFNTIIKKGSFVIIDKANDNIGYIISQNTFATAFLPYVFPLDENHTLELKSPSSLGAKHLLEAWDEMYNWYFNA